MALVISDELFDKTSSLHVYMAKIKKDGSTTTYRIPMQTVKHVFTTNVDDSVEVSPVITDNNLITFAYGTDTKFFRILCFGYF
jgi:hypothetical protein